MKLHEWQQRMKRESVTVHICGGVCEAGGPPHEDGHDFSVPFETENSGGYLCKLCGMDNISWSMSKDDSP